MKTQKPEPIVNDLDQETIDSIKKDLLSKKEQVLNEINNISGEKNEKDADMKVKFPDYGNKSDENAQEVGEYTTNLATEKILESTLRDVEGALDRIEKGTYGICKYCSQPIGKKRMLARPVASACIACKTKLQRAF
jgi:DnaK suppressor protein